jgi:ribosomal protein S18 acetylase RimI-like enzyme
VKRARSPLAIKLRRGQLHNLDALIAIEDAVFRTDNLSRRSFRHFLTSKSATLLVAEQGGKVAGYLLVLYRPRRASRTPPARTKSGAACCAGSSIGLNRN